MSDFANELKAARLRLGMTEQQAADRIGVTQSALHRWEAGDREPKLEVIENWARAVGMEADLMIRRPREGGEVKLTKKQSGLLAKLARDVADIPDDKLGAVASVIDAVIAKP